MEEILTTDQVADLLAVSPRTVEGWRIDGRGPDYIQLSSSLIRYRLADVNAWLVQRMKTLSDPQSTL